MKKIIVVLAAALIGFSANAQFYVGGSLGLNSTEGSSSFTIAPEFGYALSDKLTIGAVVGLGNNELSLFYPQLNDLSGIIGSLGLLEEGFGWQVNPYVRYTFAQVGNFSIFADGALNLGGFKYKDWDESVFAWGISINPGCAYNITDNWAVVAHFCSLGFASTSVAGESTSTFGLNINNTISSIGFYYCF